LTSAIIACASERVIGQRRRETSLQTSTHHAATAEQKHRAQLRVAIDADDDFDPVSDHLLHRHAVDPSLWRIGFGISQEL
jgi:hypothetical protein